MDAKAKQRGMPKLFRLSLVVLFLAFTIWPTVVFSCPRNKITDQKRGTVKIESWLRRTLNERNFAEFKWIDEERGTFQVPWTHGHAKDWTPECVAVAAAWAKAKGLYEKHEGNCKTLKSNFRSALNSKKKGKDLVKVKTQRNKRKYRYWILRPTSQRPGNKKANEKPKPKPRPKKPCLLPLERARKNRKSPRCRKVKTTVASPNHFESSPDISNQAAESVPCAVSTTPLPPFEHWRPYFPPSPPSDHRSETPFLFTSLVDSHGDTRIPTRVSLPAFDHLRTDFPPSPPDDGGSVTPSAACPVEALDFGNHMNNESFLFNHFEPNFPESPPPDTDAVAPGDPNAVHNYSISFSCEPADINLGAASEDSFVNQPTTAVCEIPINPDEILSSFLASTLHLAESNTLSMGPPTLDWQHEDFSFQAVNSADLLFNF